MTAARPGPLDAVAAALPHLTHLSLPCSGYPLCVIAMALRRLRQLRCLDVSAAAEVEGGAYGHTANGVALEALADLTTLTSLNLAHR